MPTHVYIHTNIYTYVLTNIHTYIQTPLPRPRVRTDEKISFDIIALCVQSTNPGNKKKYFGAPFCLEPWGSKCWSKRIIVWIACLKGICLFRVNLPSP